MKKITISIVTLLLFTISCRQQDESLSNEDLANISIIQKNRIYRNSIKTKTDSVYKSEMIQTNSLGNEVDPNSPPKKDQ